MEIRWSRVLSKRIAALWRRSPIAVILRQRYNDICTENYTLRDALRHANAELDKHKRLVAGIGTGDPKLADHLERIRKRVQNEQRS